jgi:hypothetical protein
MPQAPRSLAETKNSVPAYRKEEKDFFHLVFS